MMMTPRETTLDMKNDNEPRSLGSLSYFFLSSLFGLLVPPALLEHIFQKMHLSMHENSGENNHHSLEEISKCFFLLHQIFKEAFTTIFVILMHFLDPNLGLTIEKHETAFPFNI